MSSVSKQVRIKQAHRRVAGFLGIFLFLHFATHFAALGGIESQALVLNAGRALYRIPLVEIALFAAFVTQIGLGIALLRQINRRPQKGAWHWAQFASGAYLAYFIVMHSSAALISRWSFDLDTNFYWPAGTLILAPLKYVFAPYYTLAITAIVTHLMAALHFRKPQQWHGYALIVGPLASVGILLGYSGLLYPVTLSQPYLDYFEFYGAEPPNGDALN